MDNVMLFREYTRELERNLEYLNESDCCRCNVNTLQCFLVVEIGRKPGICVKDLSEILKTDKSAISRGIEELVVKGYVTRVPSAKDRRCVVLNLTPEGKKQFNKIESDMNARFKSIFETIEEDKREKVIEALRIYNDAFANIMKKGQCQCSK